MKLRILSIITAFAAAVSLCFGFAACAPQEEDKPNTPPPVIGNTDDGKTDDGKKDKDMELEISKSYIAMPKGGTYTLKANKSAEWTVEGTAVTVDGGVVKAVSAGEATVTATSGEQSVSCKVKVGGAMLAIGDSIFTAELSPLMLETIAEDLGYTLYRDTIGGSTIAPASGVGIVDHIDSGHYDELMAEIQPDLILINRGTNDVYWSGTTGNPLRLGTKDTTDNTKTYGALKYSIDYLQKKYPKARIVWTNSVYRTDVEIERLDEFNVILKEICYEKGVEVVNLRQAFPANKGNAADLFVDGIHPNPLGQSIYIEILEKVLCFDFSSPVTENNLKWSKSVKTAIAGTSYALALTSDIDLPATYYSTNPDVAEFKDNTVTVKKAGTVLIVAIQGNNIAVSVAKGIN